MPTLPRRVVPVELEQGGRHRDRRRRLPVPQLASVVMMETPTKERSAKHLMIVLATSIPVAMHVVGVAIFLAKPVVTVTATPGGRGGLQTESTKRDHGRSDSGNRAAHLRTHDLIPRCVTASRRPPSIYCWEFGIMRPHANYVCAM
jgi:hypothetical protein